MNIEEHFGSQASPSMIRKLVPAHLLKNNLIREQK